MENINKILLSLPISLIAFIVLTYPGEIYGQLSNNSDNKSTFFNNNISQQYDNNSMNIGSRSEFVGGFSAKSIQNANDSTPQYDNNSMNIGSRSEFVGGFSAKNVNNTNKN